MKKVRIIADSTCDLSPELVAKYDIKIVPLCIVLDEKSYFDGEDIKPEEIYKCLSPMWMGCVMDITKMPLNVL